MTGKSHIEDQAAGTYGSSEAAAGWQRSGAVRAQLLVPLTERMLDLAGDPACRQRFYLPLRLSRRGSDER